MQWIDRMFPGLCRLSLVVLGDPPLCRVHERGSRFGDSQIDVEAAQTGRFYMGYTIGVLFFQIHGRYFLGSEIRSYELVQFHHSTPFQSPYFDPYFDSLAGASSSLNTRSSEI